MGKAQAFHFFSSRKGLGLGLLGLYRHVGWLFGEGVRAASFLIIACHDCNARALGLDSGTLDLSLSVSLCLCFVSFIKARKGQGRSSGEGKGVYGCNEERIHAC